MVLLGYTFICLKCNVSKRNDIKNEWINSIPSSQTHCNIAMLSSLPRTKKIRTENAELRYQTVLAQCIRYTYFSPKNWKATWLAFKSILYAPKSSSGLSSGAREDKREEKSASDSWPNYVITIIISWFSSALLSSTSSSSCPLFTFIRKLYIKYT